MDLNFNHSQGTKEDSKKLDFHLRGLLILILPISIFVPGFLIANILAYFRYLNTLHLWCTSIIFSISFLLLLRTHFKDWNSTFTNYLISSSIAAFFLLLIFLFSNKSNFIRLEVKRLFKNDTGLELMSNANIPRQDHIDLFLPNIKQFKKLPPGEKKIWMNALQKYVSSKYNVEGKVEFLNNFNLYYDNKLKDFEMPLISLDERQMEGESLKKFHDQRKKILAQRELFLRKVNKYFSNKTIFTDYNELFIFYCFFPI